MYKCSLATLSKIKQGSLALAILTGIGLLLSGCTMPATMSPSQPSILQIARAVGRGEASIHDLVAAAGNSSLAIQSQSNPILCAIDQNDDLRIDDGEILAAVRAWVEGIPIEGQYIDDAAMLEAIAAWINGTRLVCGPSVTNKPPVAEFTFSPSEPEQGAKVFFDASASYDPDGQITAYEWDFGDGTIGWGRNVSHTYYFSGNYVVLLTVTDSEGARGQRRKTVLVQEKPANRPPIAELSLFMAYCDPKGKACYGLFKGEGSYDPDGRIVDFKFDCGGGWLKSSELPTIRVICEYPYKTAEYIVTLTVIDDKGASSQASLKVSFTAAPIDPCANRTGHVHRTYSWRYRLVEYTWEVDLPDYLICRSEQADVPRSGSFPWYDLWKLVDWPEDDDWIRWIAESINSIETVTDYYSRATNTLHFVQGMMPYRYDIYAYDVGDYWALPLETLDRQAGDCEDGAILYVALMRSMNYPVYFGVYGDSRRSGHAFAFVEVSKDWVDERTSLFNKCLLMDAWTIAVRGNKYYAMAETTIDPSVETLGYWGLGCGRIPEEYWDQGLVRILDPVTGLDVTPQFKLLKPSLSGGTD